MTPFVRKLFWTDLCACSICEMFQIFFLVTNKTLQKTDIENLKKMFNKICSFNSMLI